MWFHYLILIFVQTSWCLILSTDRRSYLAEHNAPELIGDFLTDDINSKGYLPYEKDLQKAGFVTNIGNDVTYLLSKLSDQDLIKLLNEQPKKNEYDLTDIMNVAAQSKPLVDTSSDKISSKLKSFGDKSIKKSKKNQNRFNNIAESKLSPQTPYFRLENKPVLPSKKYVDPSYKALQKLNGLLNSRAVDQETNEDDDDKKKEILFDILVSQLKALCCKSNKHKKTEKKEDFNPQFLLSDFETPRSTTNPLESENMFLILNDEVKSNGSDEVILVDPDSLDKNSTVLLLGPITTPLSDKQLKQAMNRISNELSKADYLPLLQQLADGTISDGNIKLVKSLVSGPETRRYIKPHRCNHQSKLARVYGGPKWLICTGYLNLNGPSIYDR